MLSNCSEMLVFGTYWKTWYSMVSEQTCTIDHKMDQSLWQTTESFDILHPSHMWLQTTVSCGKYCQTMQIGTVSRLRFCRRCWGFKIHFWRNIVRFRKSYVCSKKLDVSETNFSFAQFNRIWSHFFGCGIEVGRYTRALIHGIWSSQFFTETRIRVIKNGETRGRTKFVQQSHGMIVDAISSNVHSSRQQNPQRFDRINLDPKIQIKYIDTKNQLADMRTKGNFTRDEWNHFCVSSTSAISVPPIVLMWCRKERKKMQVKKESQQNRSRWWICSRDAA